MFSDLIAEVLVICLQRFRVFGGGCGFSALSDWLVAVANFVLTVFHYRNARRVFGVYLVWVCKVSS